MAPRIDPPETPRTVMHWSQWLFPGPVRVFSAAEMARGGAQRWPNAIDTFIVLNLLPLVIVGLLTLPPTFGPLVVTTNSAVAGIGLVVARWLWQQPTRWRMQLAITLLMGAAGFATVRLQHAYPTHTYRMAVWATGAAGMMTSIAWWFVVTFRVQQIDSRLRELDERDRHVAMARRLATAQIQPHFLFNTLASLQHWVETGDPRAAPLLREFTAYLRATLPMFEHESVPLADELGIVRHYLGIMQARLGDRLQWQVHASPGIETLTIPPGALLTLVENAIEHGIEPSLRGGRVEVHARGDAQHARLEVVDDGRTAPPGNTLREGMGLTNTRQRLFDHFGPAAQLTLAPSDTGFTARIEIAPGP